MLVLGLELLENCSELTVSPRVVQSTWFGHLDLACFEGSGLLVKGSPLSMLSLTTSISAVIKPIASVETQKLVVVEIRKAIGKPKGKSFR